MSDATLIALASLLVTVVTVIAGFWERARTARANEDQRRRLLIGDVIERLERVTREQARPVFARMYAIPELDLALALPRFMLLMKPEEQPLLLWLTYQSKRMQSAPSDHLATAIGIEAVGELAKWYKGERSLDWFVAQNSAARKLPEPKPRRSFRRQIRNPIEAVTIVSMAVALGLAPSVIMAALPKAWGMQRAR
jgi:hypothetical protein